MFLDVRPWSGPLLLVVLVALMVSFAPTAGAVDHLNPVVAEDAPDPHVLSDDGVYWVYTTENARGNVPTRVSTDLVNWSYTGDALPQLGSWAETGHTWAPSVHKTPSGGYVLYYTARVRGTTRQCIGRATASHPAGPFVDWWDTPIVCQGGRAGSIDPFVFTHGGTQYLLWKSEDNAMGRDTHLWGIRLNASGTHLVGQAQNLLVGDREWERPVIENPAMIEAGGKFTLFYSASKWKSDLYAIGYATCDTPLGPCQKQTTDRPMVGSTGTVVGPGGQATFVDASGQAWLAYHAWTNGPPGYSNGSVRSLHVDRLSFQGTTPQFHGPTQGGVLATSAVGVAEGPGGFWTVFVDGRVVANDGVPHHGDMADHPLNRPIVGMAATPSGDGYWLVASDGGIFSFGDAAFYGSTGAMRLNRPIVGMASSPSGRGYWLVASDGGVFTFGDAVFQGSATNSGSHQPITALVRRPGGGYSMVNASGAVFSFGD